MNKELAKSLDKYAHEIAARYSITDREQNFNKETFAVEEIIPTSDQTAVVFFKKSGGKLGMGFFYHLSKGKDRGWHYFFPTDAHITGMSVAFFYKLEVERKNYLKNFKQQE